MGTNITNKGKERLPRNKSKNLHLKKVFSTFISLKSTRKYSKRNDNFLKQTDYVQLIRKHPAPDQLRRVARQRYRRCRRRISRRHHHRHGFYTEGTGSPPPWTISPHYSTQRGRQSGIPLRYLRRQVDRLPHRVHRVERKRTKTSTPATTTT